MGLTLFLLTTLVLTQYKVCHDHIAGPLSVSVADPYERVACDADNVNINPRSWLLDGYSQIFRSYMFGPSSFWTMAPLRCTAKFDPFLSLDCAPTPSTLTQSKERKGSNFAIWQPWLACRTRAQDIHTERERWMMIPRNWR